ncbi:STAS domain-containing protein [Streptomyces prasinopilosus]|uniref:Anti-anti-sigma factor n=1 Tax=Streptomyces prasinopilosus TaxID=67344 RepID=A0A1G6M7H9_9ACTN|nr:STAS domain-containing protein [Streptomyces prasinopilosus]SDC51410.1 anti-anti-sigma factor [Streptomyces prasinopilosus]
MAAFPFAPHVLSLPTETPHTVRLALVGDLDHEIGDEVLHQVLRALHGGEDVRDLRLDCRDLGAVDSAGLAVLLQIHRRASGDGTGFHLDHVGPRLERLLRITGTYEYLTTPQQAAPPAGSAGPAEEDPGTLGSGA